MEDERKTTGYSTFALIRDMWTIIRGRRVPLVIATVLKLTSNLVWLYPAYALSTLVNFLTTYRAGDSLDTVWWVLGLWIAASIWHYTAEQTAEYIGYRVAERSALDAQLRTIDHMLRLDLSWHERENTGNKLKRIQRGGEGINRLVRIWLDNCVASAVHFCGMIPVLMAFDVTVGSVTLFFLLTYFILSRYFTGRAGEAAHVVSNAEEDLQGVAFETLNNVRSVKVLGMQEGLLGIIDVHLADLMKKIRVRITRFRVRETTLQLWAQLFRLGVTIAIVFGIVRGRYDVGFLVLFYSYFNYIWESIDQLSKATLDIIISRYGLWRMMGILAEPVRIDVEEGKRDMPNWDRIEVKNLSFAYGKTSKKKVLKDLSFTIRRGERIGIVGVSGAGKSTLFKLLLKEHEHYEGQIFIGDVPLRDIRRSDFFRTTAVVLQDTEVFNFRLRDNITLANVQRAEDPALLAQAIEVAHVTDFLDRLPEGLDTQIGEKGIRLSGGEKQRVGIARAIFKQPDLLFLDEATSHLDVESEGKIRDSLHTFFQSVTAIVIAHRLSTIKEMDRILVLEGGRIIEEGTFEELLNKGGRFRELWEKQKF